MGDALGDEPGGSVGEVVLHAAAPTLVGEGDEALSIAGRAPVVDREHAVAAAGEPLVHA